MAAPTLSDKEALTHTAPSTPSTEKTSTQSSTPSIRANESTESVPSQSPSTSVISSSRGSSLQSLSRPSNVPTVSRDFDRSRAVTDIVRETEHAANHQLAPFQLQEKVNAKWEDGSWWSAVVVAIDRTHDILRMSKKVDPDYDEEDAIIGLSLTLRQYEGRKTVLAEEEEWCYLVWWTSTREVDKIWRVGSALRRGNKPLPTPPAVAKSKAVEGKRKKGKQSSLPAETPIAAEKKAVDHGAALRSLPHGDDGDESKGKDNEKTGKKDMKEEAEEKGKSAEAEVHADEVTKAELKAAETAAEGTAEPQLPSVPVVSPPSPLPPPSEVVASPSKKSLTEEGKDEGSSLRSPPPSPPLTPSPAVSVAPASSLSTLRSPVSIDPTISRKRPRRPESDTPSAPHTPVSSGKAKPVIPAPEEKEERPESREHESAQATELKVEVSPPAKRLRARRRTLSDSPVTPSESTSSAVPPHSLLAPPPTSPQPMEEVKTPTIDPPAADAAAAAEERKAEVDQTTSPPPSAAEKVETSPADVSAPAVLPPPSGSPPTRRIRRKTELGNLIASPRGTLPGSEGEILTQVLAPSMTRRQSLEAQAKGKPLPAPTTPPSQSALSKKRGRSARRGVP